MFSSGDTHETPLANHALETGNIPRGQYFITITLPNGKTVEKCINPAGWQAIQRQIHKHNKVQRSQANILHAKNALFYHHYSLSDWSKQPFNPRDLSSEEVTLPYTKGITNIGYHTVPLSVVLSVVAGRYGWELLDRINTADKVDDFLERLSFRRLERLAENNGVLKELVAEYKNAPSLRLH